MHLPPSFLATAVLSENQYFLDLIVLILRTVVTPRVYTDSLFMTHLVRAIDWAAGG